MNFKKLLGITTFALLLTTSSAWAACTQDAECADSDPATEDVCINGYCRHHAAWVHPPTEPVPYEGPEEPEDGCMEPPAFCFEDPSQVDGPSLHRTCEASIEINESNPSVTPKEAFCCLANESNEQYAEDVWEKMKQDCGKIVKLVPPGEHKPHSAPCEEWPQEYRSCCEDPKNDVNGDGKISDWTEAIKAIDACTDDSGDCNIVVNVMGDFENTGDLKFCCQVINNSGDLSDAAIEQVCSNGDPAAETPAETPAENAPADSSSSSDDSSANGAVAEGEPKDFMHLQGGAGGCSLILAD